MDIVRQLIGRRKMLIGISGKIGTGKDTVGAIIQYLVWKKQVEEGKSTLLNYTLQDFINGRGAKTEWEIKKYAFKLKQIVALLTGCKVEDLENQEFKNQLLADNWIKKEIATSQQLFRTYNEENKPLEYAESMNWKQSTFNSKDRANGEWYRDTIQFTYRELLQKIGTEAMRDFIHENVWVNALFADYKPKYMVSSFPPPATQEEYVTQQGYPNWIITDMRFENEARAIKQRTGLLIRVERTPFTVHHSKTGEAHDLSRDAFTEHPSETALDNYHGFDCTVFNNGTIEDLVKNVETLLRDEGII